MPFAGITSVAFAGAFMPELTFCGLDAEIVFDAWSNASMLELSFCRLDSNDLVRFWPEYQMRMGLAR